MRLVKVDDEEPRQCLEPLLKHLEKPKKHLDEPDKCYPCDLGRCNPNFLIQVSTVDKRWQKMKGKL